MNAATDASRLSEFKCVVDEANRLGIKATKVQCTTTRINNPATCRLCILYRKLNPIKVCIGEYSGVCSKVIGYDSIFYADHPDNIGKGPNLISFVNNLIAMRACHE